MGDMIKTWALCAVVATLGVGGCSHSCEDVYFCLSDTGAAGEGGASGSGGQGGTDATGGAGGQDRCPEDPSDGPVAEDCGIWVSALSGDDASTGTQLQPLHTLAKAIEIATERTGRIYACGGETYVEAVVLPAGIQLSGGFDCKSGWSYAGNNKPAILAPMVPGQVALTLLGGETESLVADIEARAEDAVEPGGSSIAVFAHDGVRATLRRAHLIAGNGADGADGEAGDHDGFPAKTGLTGNNGASACTMLPGPGGAGVTLACEAPAESTGGEGGNGGELAANNGLVGVPEPVANPLGYGAGGKAEDPAQGTACTGGSAGAQGNLGLHGFGALGNGRLTEGGYLGISGGDGTAGQPGQGGGGGGASIGSILCGAAPHGGAGGGSGGSGGCGGKGGKGGQAGGSSFSLAARGGTITLVDVHMTTGNGGNGGNGGAFQLGGQGGLPGLGGLGFGGANGIKGGCGGGVGGQGGNGGNGGGGHGGHSATVGKTASALVAVVSSVEYSFGNPGKGGLGSFGVPETNGAPGVFSDSVLLDP